MMCARGKVFAVVFDMYLKYNEKKNIILYM